jgi:integrase
VKYEKVDRSLGLVRHPETGIYYFKKHITLETGEQMRPEVSLRTRDEAEARRKILQTYSRYLILTNSQVGERERNRGTTTFEQLLPGIYEIYQGKSKKTFTRVELHCRKHLLPFYVGCPVNELARRWPNYVAYQHIKNPNRMLGEDRRTLHIVLSYAVSQNLLDGIPPLKLDKAKRIKGQIKPYTPSEVNRIMTATAASIKRENPDRPDLWLTQRVVEDQQLRFELALFSGFRVPGETNSLRYDWIDWSYGTVTIPAEFTKTRTERIVVLDKLTLAKLAERRIYSKSSYVFPKRSNLDLPATSTDKSWQKFKKALGINKKLYWARHTHASEAVKEISATKVVKNMGTSVKMLEQIYDIPNDADRAHQSTVVRRRFGGIGENGNATE